MWADFYAVRLDRDEAEGNEEFEDDESIDELSDEEMREILEASSPDDWEEVT